MRFPLIASVILLCLGSQAVAQNAPKITNLQPIPLKSGENIIHNFTPDGRDGLIVQGWRDNGNAHGYNVFIAMVAPNAEEAGWDVAGIRGGGIWEDTLRDDPHAG